MRISVSVQGLSPFLLYADSLLAGGRGIVNNFNVEMTHSWHDTGGSSALPTAGGRWPGTDLDVGGSQPSGATPYSATHSP